MNLVDELHQVARALREASLPYAVCGGIAVTIHGATRSTKDIDILVAPDDVSRVLDVVRPLGYRFAALPMTFDAGTARERHVHRVAKIEGDAHLVLDFIRADAAFADLLAERIDIDLPEGTLSVVTLDALLRMKKLAGGHQDFADIEALEALERGS